MHSLLVQVDVVFHGSMTPMPECHSITDKMQKKVCSHMRMSQYLSHAIFFASVAYKALGGGGTMCGKPFTITPHESLMCSSTHKPVLQQEMPVQSCTPPLRKRKTREDEHLSEGNGKHSTSRNLHVVLIILVLDMRQ